LKPFLRDYLKRGIMTSNSWKLGIVTRALGSYVELVNTFRVLSGRRRIAPSELRRYVVKMCLVPAILVATVSFLVFSYVGKELIVLVPLLAGLTFFTVPLVSELLFYMTHIRRLKEDLTYFMVIEGVSPGDDLIKDLEEEYDAMCELLTSLCTEYSRLRLFTRFFPGIRGIKEYIARAPKIMKKTLLEYMVARESASFGTWIYSKFQESLNELKTSSKRALELKVFLSLIVVVINGLTPPLLALTTVLEGRIPQYAYSILTIPSVVLVLSESLSPKILKVSAGASRLSLTSALATVLSVTPLLLGGWGLLATGIFMTVIGVVTTYKILYAYSTFFNLPSILTNLTERLPYAHDPVGLIEEGLGRLRRFSSLASLCYIMLLKSVRQGEVNTSKMITFRGVVDELFSLVKQGTAVRILVLATAIIMPIILSTSVILASSLVTTTADLRTYCFISSALYSIIASIVVFGNYESTLLTGIVLLMLYYLGVTP